MRIFLPDIHPGLTFSFAKTFFEIGDTLYIPGHSFNKVVKYGRKWSQEEINSELGLENVYAIEYEDVLSRPPHIVIVSCAEVSHDIINNLWKKLKNKMRLIFYCGNNDTFYYYWYHFRNICRYAICADILSYISSRNAGVSSIYYYPWNNYSSFCFKGASDIKIVRSYINQYSRLFRSDYRMSEELMSLLPEVEWRCVDGVRRNEIPALMENSMATLHIKNQEGFGLSIIESLSVGRPVILYRPYSYNRTYRNWCIDGLTALYFDTEEEFVKKMRAFISCDYYRHEMQHNASRIVREVINLHINLFCHHSILHSLENSRGYLEILIFHTNHMCFLQEYYP